MQNNHIKSVTNFNTTMFGGITDFQNHPSINPNDSHLRHIRQQKTEEKQLCVCTYTRNN